MNEVQIFGTNYDGELDPEKVKCPECLLTVSQEELDMFGGLCEECSGAFE